METLFANPLTSQSASHQCAEHRLEFDPLRTPPALKCRSCGATEALSKTEMNWPSYETKTRRNINRCVTLLKTLSLTILLISLVFALLALADGFLRDTSSTKGPEIGSKTSMMKDRGKSPIPGATRAARIN